MSVIIDCPTWLVRQAGAPTFRAHTARPPGVTKRHNHMPIKLGHACDSLGNYKIRMGHKRIFCVSVLSHVYEH